MRKRETTVKPSTPGRLAAIRTRAGRSDRANRSASGPSPDAVTSNPACATAFPRARCTVGAASTTRILTAMTYLAWRTRLLVVVRRQAAALHLYLLLGRTTRLYAARDGGRVLDLVPSSC